MQDSDGRFAEHLPWLLHVAPDLVLNKDGSIMAAYELHGVDLDEDSGSSWASALADMQDAVQKLDERFYIWLVTDKRIKHQPQAFHDVITNPVSDVIEKSIRDRYAQGAVMSLKTYAFLVFTGDTGVFRFMDNVRQKMNDDGSSLIASIAYALNPANATRSAALKDARQLDLNISQARQGFAAFVAAHTALEFEALSASAMDSAIYRMANPTLSLEDGVQLRPTALLDAAMSASDVRFGRESYGIQGPNKTLYGQVVSLNSYPSNAQSLLKILAIPAEFRLVHAIHCLGSDKARKAVQENADFYEMSKSTFRQRVAAYLTGQPAELDPGMNDLYLECLDALRRQNAENLGFAYHSCSITFFADTPAEVKTLTDGALRWMGSMPVIRERLGLKAATLSTLPGQWAHNQRMMLANTELVANMLPLSTINPGSSKSSHLSEVYGVPMPSLATFTSRFGTEVHFDPFVGGVGHTLVVIPTGGGKTTFVNFCLSCFSRYPDAQVVIFDRDKSCRIVSELAGGQHIDMKTGMSLNPLAHIRKSEMEMIQAAAFVARRIEEGGEKLTAEQRQDIYRRIATIAANEHVIPSLQALHALLPRELQVMLSEWVEGGPFAYFGGEQDEFELSSWTCIEMKEIMKVDRLSRAFLDHAFASIARRLDGRPTFIYIEEASFALNNPAFLAGIDDWLKTFRKKNAFVWMTLQSPESVSGIDGESFRATIADNVPNLILGANPRLEYHRALYREMFGLTDSQVSMIGQLKPKRDYLRIAGNICRVMRTDFSNHVLSAVRSEPQYQNLLDEVKRTGDPAWHKTYLKRASER